MEPNFDIRLLRTFVMVSETGTVSRAADRLARTQAAVSMQLQRLELDLNAKLGRATELFKQHGISQMPVLDEGKLAGILTESDVLHHLVSGRSNKDTIVAEVMERKVSTVGVQASSAELPRIFERGEVAIVVDDARTVLGIVTKMDLIEMLAARKTQMPT